MNAPTRLRSDLRTAVTIMNRLHRESGEERRPESIYLYQYQRWHSSSSSCSTSWWQWNEIWWSIFSEKFFVPGSLTAEDNLLQPMGGVNCTLHTSHFLVFVSTHDNVSHDIDSRCQCVISSMFHALVWLMTLRPLFAPISCLCYLLVYLPDLLFSLLCGSVRSKIPLCTSPSEESGPLANNVTPTLHLDTSAYSSDGDHDEDGRNTWMQRLCRIEISHGCVSGAIAKNIG